MKRFFLIGLFVVSHWFVIGQSNIYRNQDFSTLPYGNRFESWERDVKPAKTYYVDQKHPNASDQNAGSAEAPFVTIGKAAGILKPGERVLIRSGVYHETIAPARGGTSAEKMIVYAAYPGDSVIVKGSVKTDASGWRLSTGWRTAGDEWYNESENPVSQLVWQYDLNRIDFKGYNPFGLLNLMQDQEWLDYKKVNMNPHFKKRGLVFIDGICLKQVRRSVELQEHADGAYWAEHNGLTLHVRFPDGKNPENSVVEITTKEQLLAPLQYGLGYIRIQGIHFLHAGNGFPVPQRGAVSARRGHHWIIEDCTIDWANSVGVDLGNEMWHTTYLAEVGNHLFRRNKVRNCGISGLQGLKGVNYLIEDNLFENIGWQDAEHGFESGAIKLHMAENTLIRRNVFRNIVHAPGIWLDYNSSKNCRITSNLFSGITTARGAVYVEVSRERCRIDHNIFHKTRSQYWISGDYGAGGNALYTDGSDSIFFDHNLAFDIENSGYGSYANAARIVGGRGGTERAQRVEHNIFVQCGKHAIEFPNSHNSSDYNVFSEMPAGYLKLKNPEPSLLLDLKAWQDYYGWEKNGKMVKDVEMHLDPEQLTLTIRLPEGTQLEGGPFDEYKKIENLNVDPRQVSNRPE